MKQKPKQTNKQTNNDMALVCIGHCSWASLSCSNRDSNRCACRSLLTEGRALQDGQRENRPQNHLSLQKGGGHRDSRSFCEPF